MARPTKLHNFQRFSLRIPEDLLKKLKHKAVDEDCSVNDHILAQIEENIDFRPEGKYQIEKRLHRYPLRIPTTLLRRLRTSASESGRSINTWIVQVVGNRKTYRKKAA